MGALKQQQKLLTSFYRTYSMFLKISYSMMVIVCLQSFSICGVLRDLVLFVQFKKREKYPWRSVNFSKVAG